MDHDASVGQRVAFAVSTGCQQDGSHARRLPDAVGVHVAREILHGVVNREAGGNAAARGIDVQMDVFLRVGHLEEQELRDDDIGNGVVHRGAKENDAVNEQAGIDVPRPLTATGLLNYNRNEKILHV